MNAPVDPALNKIGLIGAGRMGSAIALRLLDQGQHIVVWNRSPDKRSALIERGANAASSPAEVVNRCLTTLVVVRDDIASKDVYFGAQGVLTAARLNGRLVMDMTTTTLEAAKQAGHAVVAAGGAFLDAPVSGTVTPARSGQLLVMAGGEAEHLERGRPFLEMLARKIVHAGPIGSGIVMKLVLNLPLASYWQLLGEALSMGKAYGLDFETMLNLIAESKAAIGALDSKLGAIKGASSEVEFDLAGMHKDLLAMRATAAQAGLVLPSSSAAADSAGRAVDAGWGDRDLAQLVRFIANRAEL